MRDGVESGSRSDVYATKSQIDAWGFDPAFYRAVMPWCEWVCEKAFGITSLFLERPPWHSPRIFVANHASFLPLDALVLQCLLGSMVTRAPVRPLLEDYVFTLPYIGLWMSRLGSVRACQENAVLLLQQGYSVLAFPEGVKGAGKTIFERDRVQRFGRGGLVRLAIRTGTGVVPIGISGPEKAYPVLARSEKWGRALDLPFLPITPTFPLLGLLGLCPIPARLSIAVGETIALRKEAGLDPAGELGGPGGLDEAPEPDEATILRLNEVVRGRVADLLIRARRRAPR